MLNCPRCGLTNRPYEIGCSHCRTPLQDRDAAEAKRREWDALPAKLRAEQEQAFDRMRAGTEAHLRWLRSNRLTHATLGALLVCLPMNLAVFFASYWSLPIDVLIGAAAAFGLNRLGGGAWHGFGLFIGASILSLVLRLPLINVGAYLAGYWFFTCFAVLAVTGGGYLMGLKLASEHHDHAVVG
jgi:hypothetical protein